VDRSGAVATRNPSPAASVIVPANGTASSTLTLTANTQASLAPRGSPHKESLVFLVLGLVVPVSGILLTIGGSRRRRLAFLFLLALAIWVPSCGGGASSTGGGGSGAGGGGGSGTSYAVTVMAGSKTAGTITLTVN
jgi:hypothetical protein